MVWPTVCSLWAPEGREERGRGQCWVAFLGGFLKERRGSQGRTWTEESRRYELEVRARTHTQMLARAREAKKMSEAGWMGLG